MTQAKLTIEMQIILAYDDAVKLSTYHYDFVGIDTAGEEAFTIACGGLKGAIRRLMCPKCGQSPD